jgi:hydroxyethylthiazole kinase-like uncharacterized protein yjeF
VHGVHPVAAIRSAEEALLAVLPDGALMHRAAHALAVHCASLLHPVYGARVVLLVGAGNNGGDALFAGAELARRGSAVRAVLLDPARAHPAGLTALLRAGGRVAGAGSIATADLVIDGMVGIGGRGGLDGVAAELAEAAADRFTVAVDVPSGVHADSGAVAGCAVRADVTVTFGALKPGLVVGAGADLAGEVRLVDIGLTLPPARIAVLEAGDVRALIPMPDAADDKYTRGVVGIVAGSARYGGAGVLATGGALAVGPGMVRYLGRAPDAVRLRYPEVVVHEPHDDARVQAYVLGPGLGTDDDAHALVAAVLVRNVPVVVDADAITTVAAHAELLRDRSAPTVVTPHEREFARLTGAAPGDDRLGATRRAAADLGAVVLLKGSATVVAEPDGAAWVNPTGTPWLGTAGSGDVLSGIVGALLAAGVPAGHAAAAGAYLHGVAGQLAAAGGPPTAADILDAVRPAVQGLLSFNSAQSPGVS